jgi:hypothetical protein
VNNKQLQNYGDFDQVIRPKFMVGINFDFIAAKLDTEYYGEYLSLILHFPVKKEVSDE